MSLEIYLGFNMATKNVDYDFASSNPRFLECNNGGNPPMTWRAPPIITADQKTIVALEAEPMFAKELA